MKENLRFKFRARDYESERWVYGYYTKLVEGIRKYDAIVSEDGGSLVRYYIYDIKTLGQYTGLKDKNGIEIYEGDILHHHLQGNRFVEYGSIYNNYGGYMLVSKNGMRGTLNDTEKLYEVIGNIYEHSHLLDNIETLMIKKELHHNYLNSPLTDLKRK